MGSKTMIKDEIKDRLGNKIIEWREAFPRRIYFTIKKEDLSEAVKFLFKELSLRFSTASGMQTKEGFEILYHFSDDRRGDVYSVRVVLTPKSPEVESITPIFPGAEWIEREMWELLGINFKNHPNLKKLLLADDWPEGKHPLRKEE